MTPLEGFFLGVFVVLIILLPFWILSLRFYAVSDAYLALFCEQAANLSRINTFNSRVWKLDSLYTLNLTYKKDGSFSDFLCRFNS